MQDRYKFRVWNKKTKKMYAVRSISVYKGNIVRIEVDKYDENGEYSLEIFDDYECMIEACELIQCTGLKDKYGKLIFEGDIVKDELKNKFAVGFSKDYLAYLLTYINNPKETMACYPNIELEVIGNIYENPELLGGANNVL